MPRGMKPKSYYEQSVASFYGSLSTEQLRAHIETIRTDPYYRNRTTQQPNKYAVQMIEAISDLIKKRTRTD